MGKTSDKTLGTFKIDPELWDSFKALCSESEVTVTSELLRFITACVDRKALPQSDESLVKGGELAGKLDESLAATNEVAAKMDLILAAIQSQGKAQSSQGEPSKKHFPLAS